MNDEEIKRLAQLHVLCLPRSLISTVSEKYACAFYQYMNRSQFEKVFTERGPGGQIEAACVLSVEPDSLEGRLLLNTDLALQLCLRPLYALRLLYHKYLGGRGSHSACVPELILIYADEGARGQGLGHKLILQVEKHLKSIGKNTYQVKTESDPSNRALIFYDKLAFRREAIGKVDGHEFQYFIKSLS